MNLQEFLKEKHSKLTIMEGREKEDQKSLLDKEITINDYDFLNGEDGEYAVFTIKEDEKCFYFASKILTEELKDIENAGYKSSVQKDGLKIKLIEKKSKNSNRKYIAVEFI